MTAVGNKSERLFFSFDLALDLVLIMSVLSRAFQSDFTGLTSRHCVNLGEGSVRALGSDRLLMGIGEVGAVASRHHV